MTIRGMPTTTAAHDDDIVPSDMTMDDDPFNASLDALAARSAICRKP